MRHSFAILPLVLGLSSFTSARDDPPSYGIDFVRVGAPGNAAYAPPGGFQSGRAAEGRVDYEYRIGRTEITGGQWQEFVLAYAPHLQGSRVNIAFSGTLSFWNGSTYEMPAEFERWPTQVGFEFAARYCNWLHNGKINEAWAFENGAYDTSTFFRDPGPGGAYNHQETRNPDAKFWIPSVDEWVKAAFYDPNRFGDGQGGYWMYPNSSDQVPISGVTTNAGEAGSVGEPGPVGQFPDALSPWGLLDVSGGVWEMTESLSRMGDLSGRILRGTFAGDNFLEHGEFITTESTFGVVGVGAGFRIASAVPGPGVVTFAALAASGWFFRRRKKNDASDQVVRGGVRLVLA